MDPGMVAQVRPGALETMARLDSMVAEVDQFWLSYKTSSLHVMSLNRNSMVVPAALVVLVGLEAREEPAAPVEALVGFAVDTVRRDHRAPLVPMVRTDQQVEQGRMATFQLRPSADQRAEVCERPRHH
jgi:hypothetical protein